MSKNSGLVRIVVLISICITISACQNNLSTLFSDTCKVPCWRKIQPGLSTEDETNALLAGFTDIEGNKTWRNGDSNSSNYSISFELSDGTNGTIYMIDGVVALLLFSKADGIATIDNCLQEFGDPEYVVQSSVMGFGLPLGATSAWHTWFYGLNTKNGTAFGFDTYRYFGKKVEITPKTRVTVVEFYDPHSFEDLLSKGLIVNKEVSVDIPIENLYLWDGYGNIDTLYPEK